MTDLKATVTVDARVREMESEKLCHRCFVAVSCVISAALPPFECAKCGEATAT